MKFSSVAFFSVLFATTYGAQVTYDNTYDAPRGSLSTVACSNGANGLLTKGFTTFGSLPKFPFIGGAQAVVSWNSPNCGSCWNLTYQGTTISVLAIDHAGSGFNIAQRAMDTLTHGQAVDLGVVQVASQRSVTQYRLSGQKIP
ncbi:immunomodulatory protein [Rickenella mellea]|uniref:Immunomodulatory protein n=1 Tax=Rickenella mellea TaxID=50990 RepID=A0A4Y7Q815_9AGAM|nr:immunomodulatory protein [Rickenella mellea]